MKISHLLTTILLALPMVEVCAAVPHMKGSVVVDVMDGWVRTVSGGGLKLPTNAVLYVYRDHKEKHKGVVSPNDSNEVCFMQDTEEGLAKVYINDEGKYVPVPSEGEFVSVVARGAGVFYKKSDEIILDDETGMLRRERWSYFRFDKDKNLVTSGQYGQKIKTDNLRASILVSNEGLIHTEAPVRVYVRDGKIEGVPVGDISSLTVSAFMIVVEQ